MSGENGVIQVALDGAGKRTRQVKIDVLQADGTVVTTYQQVVTLFDDAGEPVNLDDRTWKMAVLERLDTIAELLGLLLEEDQAHAADNEDKEEEVTDDNSVIGDKD